MQVTITAKCAFCVQKFDAGDLIRIVCDDRNGMLCCDECLCGYCREGHATAADRRVCEDESWVDNGPFVDTDAFRDAMLDVRAGVI